MKESFIIYSGKRCEEYYKKYNLVSAVHKIIYLEDIIKEVREFLEDRQEDINNGGNEHEYRVNNHILGILDKDNNI